MDVGFLIAAQISSLFYSQAISIPLQTTRQDIPLPHGPQESDPPAEHATFSCVLNTESTGTIILRVLHAGLIIELIPLSTTDVLPIRFIFPSPIATSPGIFLWETNEIHVLAVTHAASLYRIVVPLGSRHELWRTQTANIWPTEYIIKSQIDVKECLVHMNGVHCVAIGLPNSSLLRLENDYVGEGSDHEWSETLFQHGTFLSSITSFLPALGSGQLGGLEIISITTHPWPTDIGNMWTLSRDRTLRLWKPKIGCIASRVLHSGRDPVAPGSSKPNVFLDSTPQTLLRVFSAPSQEDRLYILAFLPSISSPSSGGTFQLLDTSGNQFQELYAFEASKNTAHCHLQDFMIFGNSLYTLWDRQGQSMVEKTIVNLEAAQYVQDGSLRATIWHGSCYATDPEPTPAYLEEHLLSPGSMTQKFLEAIVRPGTFSALTLRVALDQYTDACLSLPGPIPQQLTTTYATISENITAVVGCTVNLNRDTQTGAYQHSNYWNALKRDWEGFIARCREVERNARRPLALGTYEHGEIIVIEQERIGSLVAEDLPILLRRQLSQDKVSIEPQYELLVVMSTLRERFGPQVMSKIEQSVLDILQQEIAFSFSDILLDQARRFKFREAIDEGSVYWIIGRLQSIEDLDAAVRVTLDIIGGFDVEVKREEDEVELLLPSSHSEWLRALTGVYIGKTIDARYELALSLIALLVFLVDELPDWDPSLLAEIFAVFRGVAMLKYVAKQPSCAAPASTSNATSADDVISRMENMNVSSNKTLLTPIHSLIDRLLSQSVDTHGLPGAAHRFLDGTGLLQSVSPAHATKPEIFFCERLRSLGFYELANELVTWLPRTPGASYVIARLWINLGRADDAAYLLEKLSGCFSGDHAMRVEDQDALAMILPVAELIDSQYAFYVHVSTIFKNVSWVQEEVRFAQLAISVAPTEIDTSSLWYTVIKGLSDLTLYEDAYASLMSTPYDRLKRDCIAPLVYRMCEDNAVNALMRFNFAGLASDVQDALAFKARHADPRAQPSYSRILYTWFVRRGDYRNAALVMYQRARKLQNIISDANSLLFFGEVQLEAYTVATNALSLVDPKNSWVVLPMPPDSAHESRKRCKLLTSIPEEKYAPGRFDADIVHLKDMKFESALLSAQMDMVRRDSTLSLSPDFLLPPAVIVLRLAQANQFAAALATARSLEVDMTDLFSQLTGQCLRLSRNSNIQQDIADWLLTDKVSSWQGTHADRGWRFLRQALDQYDGAETDYKYSKIALETILSMGRSLPPPWLIRTLEDNHHEYLIRTNLRYENFEEAVDYTLSLIRKSEAQLARDAPRHAASTWLPYTLIDQVLIAASAQESATPRLSTLRLELSNRVKRMEKLSQISNSQ